MSRAWAPAPTSPTAIPPDARTLAEQAFSRATSAPLITGNQIVLLRDARENYPAWLEAIASAERYIYFESYIIHDDDVGQEFAEALIARARAGVTVRLIYDWLGALGKTSPGFWRRLRDGGVEVRVFNPPRLTRPFGWVHRDHRKMLSADGRVAFVTGLCVGRAWAGDPVQGRAPWRDTGVEVRGPAVAEVEAAFAHVWAESGPPLPREERAPAPAPAGDVALRVVATTPWAAGLLRLDQFIAAAARERLWIADAYFAGSPSYVQALCAAAADGTDVRLLVPGASDIPLLRPLAKAGFRPLLEAGVRVFEWKGSMMHAKTAVADGRWARVGSSNLNVASWMGNYELDVAVEHAGFAAELEASFLEDLENTNELVLPPRRRWRRRERGAAAPRRGTHGAGPRPRTDRRRGDRRRGSGAATRAAAGALRIGHTMGAAITDSRVLAPAEARTVALIALILLGLAGVAVWWPRVLTVPFAALAAWIALVLLLRAHELWQRHRH